MYACATALVLCWTLLGLGRLFLLRRTARPAPAEAAALLAEIAGPACKRVRLMMSERIVAPGGIWRISPPSHPASSVLL